MSSVPLYYDPNYDPRWVTFLNNYITSHGGIYRAASKLHVHPGTLDKILHNQKISLPTRKKIQEIIEAMVPATKNHQREGFGELVLIKQLRSFINECDSTTNAAIRLGVRPSTLEKLLSGKSVSSLSVAKIDSSLKRADILNKNFQNCTAPKAERLKQVFMYYKQYRSLERVGKKMGITRERVRQLLVEGTRLGLFEYKPFNYSYIPKEKIISDYANLLSLNKVAKINHVSPSYLKKLMTAYSITEKELEILERETRRARCVEEYALIKQRLGHHPTTTELQNTRAGHKLHSRINRYWGTINAFRESLNIPKPARLNPVWLEPRRRLSFIARMQHLDTLRECLQSSKPMSITEIVSESGFKPNRVRRILGLLIASSEVRKVGTGVATKYLLMSD
jgi:plasmid maintenance system antidote protein VapI